MPLADILKPLRDSVSAQQTLTIPPHWGQGRAAYGGLVAAMLQTHLDAQQSEGRPLRAAQIAFIGPATVGDACIESQCLRTGKSALQAEARLLQNGAVVATLQATYGAARNSQLLESAPPRPTMKLPDDCAELPYIAGLTPEFTQHFDMRWSEGGLPFSGHESANMKGWIRFRQGEAGEVNPAWVLAIVDAWPPAVVARCQGLANLSTMTWAVGYRPITEVFDAQAWWAYQADTISCDEGYAHIRSTLWSPAGEVVAFSQQTVAVFY